VILAVAACGGATVDENTTKRLTVAQYGCVLAANDAASMQACMAEPAVTPAAAGR
jgi:hypothetical protein